MPVSAGRESLRSAEAVNELATRSVNYPVVSSQGWPCARHTGGNHGLHPESDASPSQDIQCFPLLDPQSCDQHKVPNRRHSQLIIEPGDTTSRLQAEESHISLLNTRSLLSLKQYLKVLKCLVLFKMAQGKEFLSVLFTAKYLWTSTPQGGRSASEGRAHTNFYILAPGWEGLPWWLRQ